MAQVSKEQLKNTSFGMPMKSDNNEECQQRHAHLQRVKY